MKGRHALIVGFGLGAVAMLAVGGIFGGQAVMQMAGRVAGVAPAPTQTPDSTHALASPSLVATPASPSPVPPPNSANPGPRNGAAMVYDPENHGMILFGGSTALPQPDGTNLAHDFDDTWLWDGHSWQNLDVAGPYARGSAMAAYDSVRHEIVLFGGAGLDESGRGLLFNDTWVWNGADWQLRTPVHKPEPRFRATMAFDEAHSVAVMVGGEGAGTKVYTTTTWTWDGVDWTARSPSISPTARRFAGMAYSASTKTTVLYGGTWAGHQLNDTWLWDGSSWRRGPAGPAAGWTELTYDDAIQNVVGWIYTPAEVSIVRLITWDGTAWSDKTASSRVPSPRAQASFGYDAATTQVVMYGGTYIEPVPYAETWTWGGSIWSLWQAPVGA